MTPEDPDLEAARHKARFCLVTGVAPSEYDQLTDTELDAFITVHNDMHDK